MRRTLAFLAIWTAAALAQGGLTAPRIGCYRDRAGALRPLYGTAGSFIPGAPAETGVVAAACWEVVALIKTDAALEWRDAELRLVASWPAPPGSALFALEPRGRAAFVYFATTGEILRFAPGQAPRTLPDPQALAPAEVLAIASPGPGQITILARSDAGAVLETWSIEDGLLAWEGEWSGVAGPAALQPEGALLRADETALVLTRRNGAQRRIELPARAVAIEPGGVGWLIITLEDGSTPLALRLRPDGEELFRIPEAEP